MKVLLLLLVFVGATLPIYGEGPRPPFIEEPDQFYSEFIHMLSALGIILLALLIIAWIVRRAVTARMDQLNVTSTIKVTERRVLSPKASVFILEVEGTRIIVGETPAGLVRLGELAREESKERS